MPIARIIDETHRNGLWTDALNEVLSTAGFGITDPGDSSAGLTVLLYPEEGNGGEERYTGDLLVLAVPSGGIDEGAELSRTEIMGSNRLKARHRLTEFRISSVLADELRPLVNLFVH